MTEEMRGVYYVAVGAKAKEALRLSKIELLRVDEIPVVVAEDKINGYTDKQSSRQLKTQIFDRVSWNQVCYLDADTMPHESIMMGFDILDDGWDIVITPSNNQGDELFWHVGIDERKHTFNQLGTEDVLQLQAGVFWIVRNMQTLQFMNCWNSEWKKHMGEDQAAFIRALYKIPLKVWLLSNIWNGGSAIGHRWGVIR